MSLIGELQEQKPLSQYSPAAQDALRGSMWMEKWRGTLEEWWKTAPKGKALSTTARRLETSPKPSPAPSRKSRLHDLPGVLGTYR